MPGMCHPYGCLLRERCRMVQYSSTDRNSFAAPYCAEDLGVDVQCDAINGDVTHDTWRLRCSFPVYLIAMSATAGVILLSSVIQAPPLAHHM